MSQHLRGQAGIVLKSWDCDPDFIPLCPLVLCPKPALTKITGKEKNICRNWGQMCAEGHRMLYGIINQIILRNSWKDREVSTKFGQIRMNQGTKTLLEPPAPQWIAWNEFVSKAQNKTQPLLLELGRIDSFGVIVPRGSNDHWEFPRLELPFFEIPSCTPAADSSEQWRSASSLAVRWTHPWNQDQPQNWQFCLKF